MQNIYKTGNVRFTKNGHEALQKLQARFLIEKNKKINCSEAVNFALKKTLQIKLTDQDCQELNV